MCSRQRSTNGSARAETPTSPTSCFRPCVMSSAGTSRNPPRIIASFLDGLPGEEAQQYYERYIGPHFPSDGRVDLNVAQHAVDAVATELGITTAPVAAAKVDQMYLPAV